MNSLPSDKIFDSPELKAFLDKMINVAQMMIYVFVGAVNIVKKGENAKK